MKVYELQIPKSDLEKIPDPERNIFLLFGHVHDELAFLNKLLLLVSDSDATGIEQHAMTTQAMIVGRLYCGKIHEAWEMVRKRYLKKNIAQTLDPQLGKQGRDALAQLVDYFSDQKNLLSRIRNDFAFHYNIRHLPGSLSEFGDEYTFTLIASGSVANSLHRCSEEFITVGMLKSTGETDGQRAMDRIFDDIVSIGGTMVTFLGGVTAAILHARLGDSWEDFKYQEHEVCAQHNVAEFKIPYFMELGNGQAEC